MSWKVCPRQAWYAVRDEEYGQYGEFNLQNLHLLLGQIFHKEMDKFYSKISIDEMIELVNKKEDMMVYLFKMFSPTTNEKCLDYFMWYAKIESERFIELYKESHTGLVQRFLPLYIEKFVEYKDPVNNIYRNGHFDRIDYIGQGKLRLVEYKTGESYNVTKAYKLTKLRLELYYYKVIIEKMEEFKDYTVAEWMLINPTTKQIFVSKFTILTERALDRAIPMLVEDINKKDPPCRNLNFYCGNCKFKQECLINPGKNIFDIEC